MIICAVDPGLKGGVACINTESGKAWAIPLPHIGKVVDVRALLEALPPASEVATVVVEQLGVRSEQSAQSGATQGKNWGRITGAIEAFEYPLRIVRPQDWKAKVLRGTKKDKSDAIAFAQRAYPDVNLKPGKCRTPQDGLADAICMAEYGKTLLAGE